MGAEGAMPKRILHVVSAMNRGGAETLLMNVYRHMDRSRIQFDFISHRKERCDYDDEIESLGGKIYRIDSLGQKGMIPYVRAVKKVIQTHPYTAVHCHTDYQSGFPALAAKWSGIRRIVCHSHSNQWGEKKGLKAKLTLKVLQSIIKYAATDYCACSVEAATFLFGDKTVANGKVQILKNGIDVDEYLEETRDDSLSVRDEWHIPQETKVIGHVGNFSPIKNQGFILKVLKTLLDEGVDVAVVMVGEGPSKQIIEEEARELGISNHIRLLGVRKDIPRLMKAFDVFLFPSLAEGFGMAVLEAQCAGTPCVVSDTVPKLTNMGLDLISFVSLEADLSIWSEEIKKAMLQDNKPDNKTIDGQFIKSGFHIRECVPDWLALYGISKTMKSIRYEKGNRDVKKKLLFVTLYLQTGGVEKSLLALLSSLDYDKYDVDLLLFDHNGVLFQQIPPQVHVLPPLFETYSTSLFQALPALIKAGHYRLLAGKLFAAVLATFSKGVGTGPRWVVYRHTLQRLKGRYDVAVSYLDFFCNYYVAEKVDADKKIVYNHMDYAVGNGWPCPRLERKSFSKSDYIVSVAESSRRSLATFFPEFANKMRVIHNSVSSNSIRAMATGSPVEYMKHHAEFKIVTVARLVEEKGVFLALEACQALVHQGYDVVWFMVGNGRLRRELEFRSGELGLDQHFILLGEKANPYPYMAYSDIYVQPSKTEAHCVAVEEAMALSRPIVVTDIPSFRNQVKDGETGIRVDGNANGIAGGISKLLDTKELREGLTRRLLTSDDRHNQEVEKFDQLINTPVS